jgi:hypothetical protein
MLEHLRMLVGVTFSADVIVKVGESLDPITEAPMPFFLPVSIAEFCLQKSICSWSLQILRLLPNVWVWGQWWGLECPYFCFSSLLASMLLSTSQPMCSGVLALLLMLQPVPLLGLPMLLVPSSTLTSASFWYYGLQTSSS